MKKIFVAVVVTMCSLTANAQYWIGENVGFAQLEDSGNDSFSASSDRPLRLYFGPNVGYNFNDRWALALSLSYNRSKTDTHTSYSDVYYGEHRTINSFSVTPYVRYSFAKSGMVSFFVDGGMSFGWGKDDMNNVAEYTDGNKSDQSEIKKTNSFSIGLRPGMLINLSDHFALELSLGFLGYTHEKREFDRSGYISAHDPSNSNPSVSQTDNGFGFCGNSGNLNFGVIWKF